MSHYSDSDEEEVYEEEYCMKMAASLEAKLHFSRSQSAESNGGGGGGGGGAGIGRAWQGGGATKKTYNTFHVDSFGEEDDFMDDYEFSCVAVCTYDTTTQVPDHALRTESSGDHALNLDSMGSEEGAAVATGGISPGPAAGGYIFDVGGVNEDDDDGWNSDEGGGGWGLEGPGGIQQDTTPTKVPNIYRTCGYGEWEDEVWAEFEASWADQPEKVLTLLQEMFVEHVDVHDLLCYFLRGLGRKRPSTKRHAFYKTLLVEFTEWKSKRAGNLPKNAVVTENHQRDILTILSRGHTTYLDHLTSIFQLHTAPPDELVKLVRRVLDAGRLKEGVVFIATFEIQHRFSMEQTLLPLIALDKINLIEKYIETSKELQVKFTSLLDKLCEPGKTLHLLSLYLCDCKWLDNETITSPNSKLNAKQLHKLGLRFIMKYNLDLDVFPNICMKKCTSFIHHVLCLHYVEGSVTGENMEDILVSAVMEKEDRVKLQLVCDLVQFSDVPAAAKWALKCGLLVTSLPYPVQEYMGRHKHRSSLLSLLVEAQKTPVRRGGAAAADYLALSLPPSAVIFVDSRETLQACWEAVARYGAVIGLDSEWKLIIDSSKERLAVMQLAVKDQVFLLDMIALPQVATPKTLRHFMHNLFGSKQNLKLGYSVGCDLKMLKRSWPFVSDIVSDPERLVDLQILDEMIQKRQNPCSQDNTSSGKTTPLQTTPPDPTKATPSGRDMPLHPLYDMSTSEDPLPQHPLLANRTTKPLPQILAEDTPSFPNDRTSPDTPTNGWEKPPSGLSSLVERCLGKPLDKSQQISDWERRPLRREQVLYAALDAHCLLSVYQHLVKTALDMDPNFNVAPYFSFKTQDTPTQDPDTPTQ